MLVPNWSFLDTELAPADPAILSEWQALAAAALEPSPHNRPELVLPAMRRDKRAMLALVREEGVLQLAFPLFRPSMKRPFFAGLDTTINYRAIPHVARDMAVPALAALLRILHRPLLLREVPAGGPFWDALMTSAAQVAVLDRWERAALRPRGSYAAWYETNFDRKRRSGFRRLRTRLAEEGRLEAECLKRPEGIAAWTESFLELEARGWKGQRGTDLGSDPAASAILREALPALAAAGRLRFWRFAFEGKPIAMMIMVCDGAKADILKIAYDEAFSRFSPGVLLLLHATEELFAEGVALADCCAIPDHPMFNHVWRDRLEVADVLVAGPRVPARVFRALAGAERLRRRLRGRLKVIYHRLAGIRPS